MSNRPEEQIALWRAAQAAESAHRLWDRFEFDSPIERVFFNAFMAVAEYSCEGLFFVWPNWEWRDHPFPLDKLAETVDRFSKTPFAICITPQAKIAPYRVDFAIHVRREDLAWKTFVVECDGHEFHERTKEQAAKDRARDRDLQTLGFPVFRFTGSELYRDPIKCAQEIYDVLLDWHWEAQK